MSSGLIGVPLHFDDQGVSLIVGGHYVQFMLRAEFPR
jgi:hypothetical protein